MELTLSEVILELHICKRLDQHITESCYGVHSNHAALPELHLCKYIDAHKYTSIRKFL